MIENLILCCVHSKNVPDTKNSGKTDGTDDTKTQDITSETDKTKGVVILKYNKVYEYNNAKLEDNKKKDADILIFDETEPRKFRSPLSIAQIKREHYLVTSRVGLHAVRISSKKPHNQLFSSISKEEIDTLVDRVSTPENKDEIRNIFSDFNTAYSGKITSNYSQIIKVIDRQFLFSLSIENRLGEEHRKETTYSGLATFLCRFKEGVEVDQLFNKDTSLDDIFEMTYLDYKPTRDIRRIVTNTSTKYIAVPEKNILRVIKCEKNEGIVSSPEPIYVFSFGLDKDREEIIGYDVIDNIGVAVLLHKGDNNQLSYSVEIRNDNDSGSILYRFAQDNPNSILERPKCVKLIKHKDKKGKEKKYCLVGCYRGAVYTIDCGENFEQAKVTNINGLLTLEERRRSNSNSDKHSIKQITQRIGDDDIILCCADLVFKVSKIYFINNRIGTYDGSNRKDNYIERAQLAHRCAGFELDYNQS